MAIDQNERIIYSKVDILNILKTINLVVVSMNSIAMASIDNSEFVLADEILKFLQENELLEEFASIREVLSAPFENEMIAEDMSLLENLMKDLNYWRPKR